MKKDEMYKLFNNLREEKPLIHQITNQVTMNDCANATLAAGGSPVMASSPLEAADMVKMADALVLNIGTLQAEGLEAMKAAGKAANETGIPVIFDPVGVGATVFRTKSALDLLENIEMSVIRGNASELHHLIGGEATIRGVDAGEVRMSNAEIAEKAAAIYGCIVVVSGEEDAVSDGKSTYIIRNGHQMLSGITGSGCMSTSLIGCFAAIHSNLLHAAIAGISLMGVAGEKAAGSLSATEGLGMFKVKLMDYLSLTDGELWLNEVNISEA